MYPTTTADNDPEKQHALPSWRLIGGLWVQSIHQHGPSKRHASPGKSHRACRLARSKHTEVAAGGWTAAFARGSALNMTPMIAQFYLPLTGDSREDLGMTPRQDGDRRFSASALLRYQLSHLTRYQFRPPMQSRLVLLTGRTKQSPGLYTGTYVFIQNAVCYPSRTYPIP